MFFFLQGSGKTTFLKQILASYDPAKKIYLHAHDKEEYSNLTKIELLCEDPLNKDFEFDRLQNNSVLIIEDFIPKGKKETSNLHFLLNYFSRHHQIDIFIVVHQLFFTQLSFFLASAKEIYISISNPNLILTKKIDKLYGLNLTDLFKKALADRDLYNFIGVFDCSYYIYPFNCLFLEETNKNIMFFTNDKKYYLLDSERYAFKNEQIKVETEHDSLTKLETLIKSVYPKKAGNILLLAKDLYVKLESLNAIDDEFIIKMRKKKVCHLMDLISAILSPGKQRELPDNIVQVLKYLQKHQLHVMSKLVVNNKAKKYLCIGVAQNCSNGSDDSS